MLNIKIINLKESMQGEWIIPQNMQNEGEIIDDPLIEIMVAPNAHERAYDYSEKLENRYSDKLENFYKKIGSLLEIVGRTRGYHEGLKKAIEYYKIIINEDEESFILINFLEIFYEKYTFFTEEMHENIFKFALSLACENLPSRELLMNIYS